MHGNINLLGIIASKQTSHLNLTAISGVTAAADKLPYFTSTTVMGVCDLTTAARTLLDDTTVGAMRATLGINVLADHFADASTTHTDGTEDDIYTDTLAAGTLANNGEAVEEEEYAAFVSSATAARRLKKYFGGTLIFDSGSLTLSLGGDFFIYTQIIRESATVVRCVVSVTSTSASSVPYTTYTRITGLTLSNTQILKTTGIASGTGAASGDILCKMAKITKLPTAS